MVQRKASRKACQNERFVFEIQAHSSHFLTSFSNLNKEQTYRSSLWVSFNPIENETFLCHFDLSFAISISKFVRFLRAFYMLCVFLSSSSMPIYCQLFFFVPLLFYIFHSSGNSTATSGAGANSVAAAGAKGHCLPPLPDLKSVCAQFIDKVLLPYQFWRNRTILFF